MPNVAWIAPELLGDVYPAHAGPVQPHHLRGFLWCHPWVTYGHAVFAQQLDDCAAG